MNHKKRLGLAMNRQPVDRVPVICPGGMMNLAVTEAMQSADAHWPEAHTDPHKMAALTNAVYTLGGFENYGVPFCMTVEAEALGAPVTLGTACTEPRINGYLLNSCSAFEQLPQITFDSGRTQTVLEAIRLLNTQSSQSRTVPIIGNLTGPISLASSLVDANVFYKEMRKNPEAVHKLLDFLTEQLIAFGKAQLEAGADLIAISDPSGTGEILGPKLFAAFVIPYLNRITETLTPLSPLGTIVHICGRLGPILEELNELHCPVLSFDSITSVSQVRAVTDKAIMGNVSTHTLEFGEPHQIKNLTHSALRQGVDILAPACGIGARTRIVQLQTMISAAQEYRYESVL